MALSKNNFYSGCSIMKDYTLDNYVKGLYYDKKLGRKTPIPEGINKYNKQFILQLNDLNMQFFGLLRAESIGQYNVITYSYKFNFSTYLEFIYSTHTKYMNKIRQYFQTRPSDLKPNDYIEHYIQSQQTHTILLKKLKDFKDKEGLQHLYIILAGHDESKIMSVGIKGNTDLTLRKYISQKTKFFISYNEAMKAVIDLVRNSDTELYTVHEIDLSTIAI